ncbi:MAG: PEP-CTERM sorting domain-containing protein [Pirellulales bacterium]|nr:PEP-CTERM sorting domain-containing protein [Pirellulales bacterium]
MKKLLWNIANCAVLAACTASAHAAVVMSVETDKAPVGGAPGSPYSPTFTAGGPSATDLINGMAPSASNGNFQEEDSTGTPALTNGTVATFYGNQTSSSDHTAYATGHNGDSVTYDLGGAFNLSSIVIYGGWNDGGRDQQRYDLLVSTDNGANYSVLGSIDVNPGIQNQDTTPISTRVEFTEDALPFLASGATNVRVNFLGVENGYTGYAEIDVFGVRVPEPASLVTAGVGMLSLAVRRRRNSKCGHCIR